MSLDNQWARIERSFDAPINQVWEMWTDASLFAQWYGPMGMTIPVAEMDVTPGGRRKICMEMKARNMTIWFTGEYKVIEKPTRLVYTESMCDPDGNIIPPSAMGMPEGHPEVTEIIVELFEDGDTTKMTLTHIGVPAESPGEGGWRMSIDKMAALLEG